MRAIKANKCWKAGLLESLVLCGLSLFSSGAMAAENLALPAPSTANPLESTGELSLMAAPVPDRRLIFADGSLYASGFGMAIRSTPSDNAGSPYAAETGFGFGILAGWRKQILGFELGFQQLDRRFEVGGEQISTEYQQVPALMRLWLGDSFTLGFGPSFSVASGTVVVADAQGRTRNLSFDQASLKPVELGFVMNTQVHLLSSNRMGVLLGAQYAFSLLNHATRGDFRYTDVQFFAGVRVGAL